MQLEVPKKLISCLRYPLSWSIGLCCERYIRVSLVAIVKGTWQKVVFVCFFVFIYLFLCIFLYPFFLPNVIVTKRKEGRKKGEGQVSFLTTQSKVLLHIELLTWSQPLSHEDHCTLRLILQGNSRFVIVSLNVLTVP